MINWEHFFVAGCTRRSRTFSSSWFRRRRSTRRGWRWSGASAPPSAASGPRPRSRSSAASALDSTCPPGESQSPRVNLRSYRRSVTDRECDIFMWNLSKLLAVLPQIPFLGNSWYGIFIWKSTYAGLTFHLVSYVFILRDKKATGVRMLLVMCSVAFSIFLLLILDS